MNLRRRAMLLLARRPTTEAATGPATETVRPNAGTIALGGGNPVGTMPGLLADQDLSTYVDHDNAAEIEGIGFTDLALSVGRGIASFTVAVTAISGGSTGTVTPTIAGVTLAGSGALTGIPPGDFGVVTAGPFTKSGGGNLTAAEIDSLTCHLVCGSLDYTQVAEIAMTVTYAVVTETVAINSIGSKTGTVTGAADTTAGAITVLNDGSDATYVGVASGNSTSVSTVGWADLVGTGNVASFVINLRGNGSLGASTFANITPTPASQSVQQVSSASTVGPFTKSGGGTWTPAEFNAMTCQLASAQGVSGGWRLYRAELVVTYA